MRLDGISFQKLNRGERVLLSIKKFVRERLKSLDIGIVKYSRLEDLVEKARVADYIQTLLELPHQDAEQLLKLLPGSRSQLGQDLFVLSELNFKRGGFFCEFGAASGVEYSNSFLLEKEFGWSGILAEPARRWHQSLRENRNCTIETDCVWSESNSILKFNEVEFGELSTIDTYSSLDHHAPERKQGRTYDVKTISLLDLLDKHHAPKDIDFISIDTEGSELEILSKFDFDKYRFKTIAVEHNFTPQRDEIFSLLAGHGYVRKFEGASRFDDWYVRAS
jgi:FkbM family methyltransferase